MICDSGHWPRPADLRWHPPHCRHTIGRIEDSSQKNTPEFWKEWAAVGVESSPLYGALATAIAEDDQIRAVTNNTRTGQLPPNMLFGAVHYLLLTGTDDPLRRFYRTLGGDGRPQKAYPEFRAFVLRHQDAIESILEQRAVQTNEVARSSILLPAYDFVTKKSGGPLAIIELGTSAGLNLVFDRYRYSYNPGPTLGSAVSAVNLECLVKGGDLPDIQIPDVAWRRGVDLNPLDVTRQDDALWLQALIWPDQEDRFQRLQAAIAEFKTDPPRLDTGGADSLPQAIAEVPSELALCISHSFMLGQLDEPTRQRLDEVLVTANRQVHRVSFEPDSQRDGWWLNVTTYEKGRRRPVHLADAHFHGAWIRWLEEAVG